MCNNVTTAELNFCDIGIAVCSIVGGTPEFSRLLAADTAYIDEKAFFDYRAEVRWGELENGHYILRLYKRDKGNESSIYLYEVNSPIRYFGQVSVKLPASYNFNTDTLLFKMWLDTYGNLSAEVTHERKVTAKAKMANLIRGDKLIQREGYFILNKIQNARVEMK